MTLKLQVGSSRKLATNDFGSHGAHCGIELSLDPLAMEQPEVFQQRLTRLFATCREAVEEELQRQLGNETVAPPAELGTHSRITHDNGQPVNRNGNGNGSRRTARGASEKQLKFIRTLASAVQGLDHNQLELLSERMFNSTVDHLSSMDASAMIDTLQGIKQGRLQLQRLLDTAGGAHDEL